MRALETTQVVPNIRDGQMWSPGPQAAPGTIFTPRGPRLLYASTDASASTHACTYGWLAHAHMHGRPANISPIIMGVLSVIQYGPVLNSTSGGPLITPYSRKWPLSFYFLAIPEYIGSHYHDSRNYVTSLWIDED